MKKKVTNLFKFILITLLFFYITIYLSDMNGSYAYSNYQKSVLTEDGIQKFEEDVRNGNAIDVNNYVTKDKDYSNNISRRSLELSNMVGSFIRTGIVDFFDKVTSHID